MRHRRYKNLVLGILFLLFTAVTGLELATFFCSCNLYHPVTNPHSILICDVEGYTYNEHQQQLVEELQAKWAENGNISKEEAALAIEQLVVEGEPDLLYGVNGTVCHGTIFIRNELPPSAKKFVGRHELEHLLGEGNEAKANWAAAKDYPLGLVTTIISSLTKSLSMSPSFCCFLVGSWKIFKVYFLGLNW